MRFSILLILLFKILVISAQDLKKYTLVLDIQPSFITSKTWMLHREQKECSFNNIRCIFTKKDALLKYYFYQLDTVLKEFKFKELGSYGCDGNGAWTDGTMTYGKLYLSDTIKIFNFHSGNSDCDCTQIKLIDVFFNIVFYLYNNKDFQKSLKPFDYYYLEEVEHQVIRTPIRQVSIIPLEYRLYDRVYTFNYKSVMQLLDNLPETKPVIIEIGKYFKVDKPDEFFDPFKKYVNSRKNIIWIAPGDAKYELTYLGLKKEYIFDNIIDSKKKKSIGLNSRP
jgi:hypothetical protein